MRIGMDVGSTTLKCVAIDDNNNIVYKAYERHFSKIAEKSAEMLSDIVNKNPEFAKASLMVSGSAGMGFANSLGLDFIQEVYATRVSVSKLLPGTDAVIELGGEDAKILFFTNGVEVRMNPLMSFSHPLISKSGQLHLQTQAQSFPPPLPHPRATASPDQSPCFQPCFSVVQSSPCSQSELLKNINQNIHCCCCSVAKPCLTL